MFRVAGLLVGCALLAACTPSAPPAPKTMLSLKDLMERVVDPSADVFWGASGSVITVKGETSRAPTTDAAANGMKAAAAKDERAVFDTGGKMYEACLHCHMKYLLGYP